MAKRRIRLLGDPVLRAACSSVEEPRSPATRLLVDDLRDTLKWAQKKHGMGRSLAAPQIGAPVRMVYLELPRRRWVMINPEIADVGADDFLVWDDCYSFPNLVVRVQRAHKISLRYVDLRGREHTTEFEGPLAELLQHEIDHLDGVLAVDRAVGLDPFYLKSEWTKRHSNPDRYGEPQSRETIH